MAKVTLAIIFNHKFNKNIPILSEIYKDRFSNIVFIVPFLKSGEVDSNKYNIITVYESSYSFQGYIAQAMNQLKKSMAGHIIFLGDDLILNPKINEDNYRDFFCLDDETSFNVEICKINDHFEKYIWKFERISENLNLLNGSRFINTDEEIPSVAEACEIASRKGYKNFNLIRSPYYNSVGLITKLKCLLYTVKNRNKVFYPAFGGYSDLTIIATDDASRFAHYCGVFAAMGIFVEVAIPTAMVLSCEKYKTIKDTEYSRGDIWGVGIKEKFNEKFSYSLKNLFEKWPEKTLYIHPVKLSQWELD